MHTRMYPFNNIVIGLIMNNRSLVRLKLAYHQSVWLNFTYKEINWKTNIASNHYISSLYHTGTH